MIDLFGEGLFVDAIYGDDSTAQANRVEIPYKTIAAAVADAEAGEVVYVRPGTYDERNFLKDDVDLYFHPGAIVDYTGLVDGAVMADGADGAAGAIDVRILGHGIFRNSSAITTGVGGLLAHGVIHLSNVASVLYMEATEVSCTVNSDQENSAILITDGAAEIHLDLCEAAQSEALGTDGGTVLLTGKYVATLTTAASLRADSDGMTIGRQGAVLVSGATAAGSIEAAGAQNIRIYGIVSATDIISVNLTELTGATLYLMDTDVA